MAEQRLDQRTRVVLGHLNGDELYGVIVREADREIESLRTRMAKQDQTQDLGAVRYLQGMIAGIEMALGIPKRQMQEMIALVKRAGAQEEVS